MSLAVCLFWTAVLSFMPISELRGAIPFAVANGVPWRWAFLFAVMCNILVAPACWVFLATVHKLLYGTEARNGVSWYKNLFDKLIERARKKLSAGFEKWGWLGIAVFVGIPFPLTGACRRVDGDPGSLGAGGFPQEDHAGGYHWGCYFGNHCHRRSAGGGRRF